MKKLIVVTDWGDDSLTRQEVRSTIEGFLKDPTCPNISFVSSTPSTIHTAFLLAQIVETEERYGRPLETLIFQNTDPRIQSKDAIENAKGAEFVVMRLKSGIYVMGPNAGYNNSLIKPKIDELYSYEGMGQSGQFRSRDIYPKIAAYIMDELEDDLELEEIPDTIPVLEGYYVGHIDNYGNIKTTIKLTDLREKHEFGESVTVKMNGAEKTAKFVKNLFGASPGELVIYPGSSGAPDDPYIEITVWRHFTESEKTTGVHAFNHPQPGTKIEIIK